MVNVKITKIITCFVLLLPLLAVSGTELTNQLKNHPSPYLAMHGDDPVAWQPWGKSVVERAKRENKLLFVSIGYFSCHWCHVMQRESYSDKRVAKYLNGDFIPVKVDRELNPALDAYLIDFVQRTRGHAGWPLNVFVTPDGHPLVGATYIPTKNFLGLLNQLVDLWKKDSKSMRRMAVNAAANVANEAAKNSAVIDTPLDDTAGNKFQSIFVQHTMQIADEMLGGFGDRTKFPMTSRLLALLSAYERKPSKPVKEFLILTLDQMATQGLRDHVGGGFFRYTVDPGWQTPHFEKMLYTNAELASLFIRAAKIFKRVDYEGIARETLDFIIREFGSKKGAMVASLSAVDDKGVEGGYYLWDAATLKKLLSKQEFQVVYQLWEMDQVSHLDAGYLPHHVVVPDEVAKNLNLTVEQVLNIISAAQLKLFKARKARRVPVDTKLLASWNGLTLSAMVDGARLKNGEKYRKAAQGIRDYIVNQLWDGQRLFRARGKAGELGVAGLEDYAYVTEGLLSWAIFTNNKKDEDLAKQWIESAWLRFFTTTGWQLSDQMLLPNSLGMSIVEDGAIRSPSTALLRGSLLVARRDNNVALKKRIVNALSLGQGLLSTQAFTYAGQVALIVDYQAVK